MIEIQAISAFTDNYIWLLKNPENQTAICVDPGDAQVVLNALKEQALQLVAILITHHHWDHTGGILALLQHYDAKVYCPKKGNIAGCTSPLVDGDTIFLPTLGMKSAIMEIPGHTLDHICYHTEDMLFCGDTLFAAGCGRVFEGTVEQMYHSLSALAALADNTRIYCGHEYTLSNLQFALQVEPNNPAIIQRLASVRLLRQQNQMTLPSTLEIERQTNPFLRCHLPSVQEAASRYCGKIVTDPVATFALIRTWKNSFK